MDRIREERIAEMKARLLALLTVPKEKRTEAWQKCVLEVKKGIEITLYDYVRRGCSGRYNPERYPELVVQYDPKSYELLDEKIKVLGEIARNPGCEYQKIEGFEDILEKKQPDA